MDLTKHSILIGEVFSTEEIQLEMELDSKLNQECQDTEHFSGMNILVETNSDLELETTNHITIDNGGSSTQELELSEPIQEDLMLFLTKLDKDSELEEQLLLVDIEEETNKRFSSIWVQEETWETMLENVLMFGEERTETTSILLSGTVIMDSIKDGF